MAAPAELNEAFQNAILSDDRAPKALVELKEGHDRLIWVNDALLAMLGYELHELLGESASSFFVHSDMDVQANKKASRSAFERGFTDSILTLQKKNGTRIRAKVFSMRSLPGLPKEHVLSLIAPLDDEEAAQDGSPYRNDLLRQAERIGQAGAWKVDPRTRAMSCSENLLRLLGAPTNTDPALAIAKAFRKSALKRLWRKAMICTSSGEDFIAQETFKRSDGEIRNVRIAATPERDPLGQFRAVVGVVQDITDEVAQATAHKETLARVSALETDLQSAIAATGIAMFYFSDGEGEASPELARILGMDRDGPWRCSAEDWFAMMHPDDAKAGAKLLSKPIPLKPGDVATDRYRLRHADGRYVWVEARREIERVNKDGTLAAFRGVIIDIDERVRSEQSLRELRERLDWARAAARIGLWNWDAATDSGVWTPECTDILQMPKNAPFDLFSVMQRAHSDDKKATWDEINRVMLNGQETFSSTFRYRPDGGDWIWLEAKGRATHGPEGPVKIFGSLRDVTIAQEQSLAMATARRQAEEAARAKASFLATMSHEIRTPLNAIIGMTRLMMDYGLEDTLLQYAETANTAGQHLLSIVNDILDLSRLESDKIELDEIDFDLRQEVLKVIEIAGAAAQEKGLPFTLAMEDALDGVYLGDAARLRQVLLNIANNAVKFTNQGGVKLCVEPGVTRGAIRFTVEDSGIGISPQDQARLFEDFVQIDAGANRQYGGSGLGLAISRRLVDLMGGRIWVESEVGVGSRFMVELPLEALSDYNHDSAPKQADQIMKPLKVLIAEDHPANQMLIEAILKEFGCTAHLAADGGEAIDAADAERFDVIILDVEMPRKDGFQTARAIREAGPNKATPLLALTAHANSRADLLEAGFNDLLSKPFTPEGLASKLTALMDMTDSQALENSLNTPIVNEDSLRPILAAAGAEVVASILDSFWEQADRLIADLETAVSAGDEDAAQKLAHELKGCAANVGAGRISAIAAAMERTDAETRSELMPKLKSALEDTRPALTEFVATAAS